MIVKVALTDDEESWRKSRESLDPNEPYTLRLERFEDQKKLARSLIEREAIPKVRRDWFNKADLNIGGYGQSRRERFKVKLDHPHFWTYYLKYFIDGPALSSTIIEWFVAEAPGPFYDPQAIDAFVRKETRVILRSGGDRPADEFFKLALEVGYHYPRRVYDASMQAKIKR